MIRFLPSIMFPIWAVGTELAEEAITPVWVHDWTVREHRHFTPRVQPIHVQPGHHESTDPFLDTEQD